MRIYTYGSKGIKKPESKYSIPVSILSRAKIEPFRAGFDKNGFNTNYIRLI